MAPIFPAATNGGGQCFATPDVCLTPMPPPSPPAPIAYPNFGMLNEATKTSTKVKFVGKEVVTVKSEIPRSTGDEAGTNGGVVSGCNMGKVTFKKGSSKIKVEGQQCVHLASPSAHNGANANMPLGFVVAPSQVKVIIAP